MRSSVRQCLDLEPGNKKAHMHVGRDTCQVEHPLNQLSSARLCLVYLRTDLTFTHLNQKRRFIIFFFHFILLLFYNMSRMNLLSDSSVQKRCSTCSNSSRNWDVFFFSRPQATCPRALALLELSRLSWQRSNKRRTHTHTNPASQCSPEVLISKGSSYVK